MTTHPRARRTTMVATALTAALIAPIVLSTPALAAPLLTEVDVTDGVTTGGEVEFEAGSDVTLVLNGQSTGAFEFTGCWSVAVGDGDPVGPATAQFLTWTAGTAVTTLFSDIDLDPEATTEYNIVIWEEIEPGAPCVDDWENISYITMVIEVAPDPESMTLTGSPTAGSTVTATAKVPGSLVGADFDLWVCPDTTIRPDDNAAEGANGACVGPFIQARTGDSTQFFLGYDPVRDADNDSAQAFWDAACGKFFVVHDYPGGGHSNWIGPIGCASAPAELAQTGTDSSAGLVSIAALAAMLLGGVLLLVRRTQRASIR